MGWDFFCKIFCVSVRESTDRRTETRKQFAAVGLLDRVEFYIVEKDKHPEDIERGIYESHIKCIQKGLDAGARHILIFEDDILFDRFDAEKLKACTQFLKSKKEWKVLLLGCLVNGLKPTESKSVMKVKHRSLSHAYALNRKFAREIVRIPWPGCAYDCLFCPMTKESMPSIRRLHFKAIPLQATPSIWIWKGAGGFLEGLNAFKNLTSFFTATAR